VSERLLSVVIAARNAAATIDDQLEALAAQNVDEQWEVVLCDNGSTDTTTARARAWAGRLPSLRVVDASRRQGVAYARNVGVRAALGDRLLMCDADDVVARDWVRHLGAALSTHDLVSGLLDRSDLNPTYQGWSGWTDVTGPRVGYGYLPFVPTGNLGFRRELFEAVGGFDATLRRGEDKDFTWRAARVGAVAHVVPEAIVAVRLPPTRLGLARKGFADGRSATELYLRHRSHGMANEPLGDVLRSYRWLISHVPELLRDGPTSRALAYDGAARLGRLVGAVRHMTAYF
jgi:glycosyltransferase involved in cell wall biosynthesis